MATNKRGAVERRNLIIVGLLEKLSRHRPLDATEAALMEEMLHRSGINRRERWWWTKEEDAALARLNSKWARFGRPLPYQQDDSIRQLAEQFGRTYWAVHRRLERLRKARGWKRPQMFKRANGNGGLKCANGQGQDTAADVSGTGRPPSIGYQPPAEGGRPQTGRTQE